MQRGFNVPLGPGGASGNSAETLDRAVFPAVHGVAKHGEQTVRWAAREGALAKVPGPASTSAGNLAAGSPGHPVTTMLTSTPTAAVPTAQHPALAQPRATAMQFLPETQSLERTSFASPLRAGGELEEGEILDDEGEATSSAFKLEPRIRKFPAVVPTSSAFFAEGYHLPMLRNLESNAPLAAYSASASSVREYQRKPRSRSPSSPRGPSASGSAYSPNRLSHQYGRPLPDRNVSSGRSDSPSSGHRRTDYPRREHYSSSKSGTYYEYHGTRSLQHSAGSPSWIEAYYRENGLRRNRRSSPENEKREEKIAQEQLSVSDEEALVNIISQNPDEILLRIHDLPLTPQDIASLFVKFGRQIPVALHRLCSAPKSKQPQPSFGPPPPSEPPMDPRQPIVIDDENEVDMDIEDEGDVEILQPELAPKGPVRPWFTTEPDASVAAKDQRISLSAKPSPSLAPNGHPDASARAPNSCANVESPMTFRYPDPALLRPADQALVVGGPQASPCHALSPQTQMAVITPAQTNEHSAVTSAIGEFPSTTAPVIHPTPRVPLSANVVKKNVSGSPVPVAVRSVESTVVSLATARHRETAMPVLLSSSSTPLAKPAEHFSVMRDGVSPASAPIAVIPTPVTAGVESITAQKQPQAYRAVSADKIVNRANILQPPVAPLAPSPPKRSSSSLSLHRPATPRSQSSMVITLSNSDDEEDPEDHVARFLRSCRDSVAGPSAATQKEESEAVARRRKEEDQARVLLEEKEKQIEQMKARIMELEKSKKRVSLDAAPASPAGSASSVKVVAKAAKPISIVEETAPAPSSVSAELASSQETTANAPTGPSSDLDAHAALLRAQLIKRLPFSGTRSLTSPKSQLSKEVGSRETAQSDETASDVLVDDEASAAKKALDDEVQRADGELARYKSSLADTQRLQEEQEAALQAVRSRIERLTAELAADEAEVKRILDEEKQRTQKRSFLEVIIRNQEARLLGLTEKARLAGLTGSAGLAAGAEASPAGQKRRPSSPAARSSQDAKRVRADSVVSDAAATAAADRRAKDEEIADLKAAMVRVQNEQAEIRKAAEERRLADIARSSRATHPRLEAVLAGENRVAAAIATQPPLREAVIDTTPLERLIELERNSSTIIELVGSEGFYQPESEIALLSTFMSKHDTGLCASEESFVMQTDGLKPEDHYVTFAPETETAETAPVLRTFQPYESPLAKFRLGPGNLEDVPTDEIIKYIKAQKFDPVQRLCIFETSGGECNDDTCTSQHFRDIEISEDDVLAALAAEHPVNTMDRSSYLSELKNCIRKAQLDGKKTAHDLIEVIARFQKERGLNILDFKAASRAQAPAARPSRRTGDEPTAPSRLTAEQISAGILRVPVTVAGLVKRLDGETDYQGRYFDSALAEDEYEGRVRHDPGDPVVWINWSVSQLPEEVSQELLAAPGVSLDQSIAILSKCLPHHPHCEPVWALYLELLCRRGKDEKIRDMFLKALDLNPNCPEIYWRFYQWEPMYEAKSDILFRMIAAFSHSNRLGSREHSLLIFSVLMQLFRLAAEYPASDPHIKLFFLLLQENATLFFDHLAGFRAELNTMFRYQMFKSLPEGVEFVAPLQLLFPDHAAMVWMAYLHWCAYFKVPGSAFHCAPYSYRAKDKYMYEVIWPQDITLRYERYSGIGSELRRLATSGALQFAGSAAPSADEKRREITESIRAARGVLWRNMVSFFRAAGRLAEIQNYVIKFETKNPSSPDAVVLALEVKDDVRCAEKRLKKVAARNGVAFNSLFNRSLKYLIGRVTVADLRVLLHYFIKSCFVTSDAMDTAEKSSGKQSQALVLYRYLLGLGVPDDAPEMPMVKDHVEKRRLRSNLCLWMHYLIMQVLPQSPKGQKSGANPHSPEVVVDVRRTFQQALHALHDAKDREVMWKEWIRFEVALNGNERSASLTSDQQIVSVFAKATEDLRSCFGQASSSPYIAATSSDWISKTPVVDYSYMERIMETTLPDIPKSTAGDLAEALYRRFPKSLGVILRVSQHELSEKRIRDARRILLESLKRMPTQAILWKLVGGLEILVNDRDPRIAEAVAQAAVPFLPPGEIAAVTADIDEVAKGTVPEPQLPTNGIVVKIER